MKIFPLLLRIPLTVFPAARFCPSSATMPFLYTLHFPLFEFQVAHKNVQLPSFPVMSVTTFSPMPLKEILLIYSNFCAVIGFIFLFHLISNLPIEYDTFNRQYKSKRISKSYFVIFLKRSIA